MPPDISHEKKLWKKGFANVAGLDEAGRGPLAGPVVAAAVSIKKPQIPITNAKKNLKNPKAQNVLGINWSLGFGHWGFDVRDSKQLSEKKREELYSIITDHPDIQWGIGIVSEKVIDKLNILQATKLAMQKAISKLDPDFLLIDGNFSIKTTIRQQSIIKGDQKVFSIAAASIIAKVTRDRLMTAAHKKFPRYGFDLHKGYGTKLHVEALAKHGPSSIHRKTFHPVSRYG